MMIRTLLGAAALFAASAAGSTATERTVADSKDHHAHFMKCAKVCADCGIECDMCFVHCRALLAQGQKDHEGSMQMCADCAEVCKMAATLTARQSALSVDGPTPCAWMKELPSIGARSRVAQGSDTTGWCVARSSTSGSRPRSRVDVGREAACQGSGPA